MTKIKNSIKFFIIIKFAASITVLVHNYVYSVKSKVKYKHVTTCSPHQWRGDREAGWLEPLGNFLRGKPFQKQNVLRDLTTLVLSDWS